MLFKKSIAILTVVAVLTTPTVFANGTDVGGIEKADTTQLVVQTNETDETQMGDETMGSETPGEVNGGDNGENGQVQDNQEEPEPTPLTNYEQLPEEKKIASLKPTKETVTQGYSVSPVITLNNGNRLPQRYYETVKDTNYKIVGSHTLKVHFIGDYEGYPDSEIPYRVIPPAPGHIFYTSSINSNSMTNLGLYVSNSSYAPQKVHIIFSTNKDLSNAKQQVFAKRKDNYYLLTGLTKNTRYYITAYNENKGNDGKPYYSENSKTVYEYKTAAEVMPVASLANTKWLYGKLKKGKTITIKKRLDSDNAFAYVNQVRNLYPYLFSSWNGFWYRGNWTYEGNGIVTEIKFVPKNPKMIVKTQAKVNSIVNGAKKKKSTAAKVKYVNKRIKKACSYDYTFKRKYRYGAYGCLVEGKAVCNGYAETFRWCMTDLGIPNKYQTGKNHIWNLVYCKYKKKTRWWVVDVTWNDCLHRDKYLFRKKH